MPDQIADLVGSVLDGDVRLKGTDMSGNETFLAVERAEEGVSRAYETIANLPPDSVSCVDTTAKDGAVYSYRMWLKYEPATEGLWTPACHRPRHTAIAYVCNQAGL